MGDEGAEHIGASLKYNKCLKQLHIGMNLLIIDNNNITQKGGTRLFLAMRENCAIEALSLSI